MATKRVGDDATGAFLDALDCGGLDGAKPASRGGDGTRICAGARGDRIGGCGTARLRRKQGTELPSAIAGSRARAARSGVGDVVQPFAAELGRKHDVGISGWDTAATGGASKRQFRSASQFETNVSGER